MIVIMYRGEGDDQSFLLLVLSPWGAESRRRLRPELILLSEMQWTGRLVLGSEEGGWARMVLGSSMGR